MSYLSQTERAVQEVNLGLAIDQRVEAEQHFRMLRKKYGPRTTPRQPGETVYAAAVRMSAEARRR